MNVIDSNLINQPCIITHEEQEWQGIFFDWSTLDDETKEFLDDELGDEMFENTNLVPVGIFSFIDDEINFSNIQSYIENAIDAEVYLMLDKKKGTLHESGRSQIDISIEELNPRLK